MGYSPASAIPLNAFGQPTANIPLNSHKFTALLDGSTAGDSAGYDQLPYVGTQYAYVVSGCTWSVTSGLTCAMAAGTIAVNGILYTVGAVASHAFAASNDTYVDINIQSGAAVVNYTAVPNWTTSPALVSSGTCFNTIRIAIAVAGAATVGFFQGIPGSGSTIAQPSSTVAAGSTGQTISALTSNQLAVASSSSFPSGGGWAVINHTSGTGSPVLYVIQFTGTSAGFLTGITSGGVITGAGIVTTGDNVTGALPIGVCDSLGNLMYCTQPYPKVIGWQQFQNTITTTNAAAAVPLQVASATSFIAPFIVPAGPTRLVRIEANLAFLGSSAAAGTTLTVTAQATNAGQTYGVGIVKVAVASDGTVMFTTGVVATPPGTYYAQLLWQQGAAGTMTAGAAYLNSNIAVEFV